MTKLCNTIYVGLTIAVGRIHVPELISKGMFVLPSMEENEHPKFDYDKLIAENGWPYSQWWILWKRIHPEWGIQKEEPILSSPPKPKPTFKPLTCKRCNNTWTPRSNKPPTPGQSHLIFGPGSTSCVITSQLSKLCCVKALCKALENLDAIALPPTQCPKCKSPYWNRERVKK